MRRPGDIRRRRSEKKSRKRRRLRGLRRVRRLRKMEEEQGRGAREWSKRGGQDKRVSADDRRLLVDWGENGNE